MKAPKYQRSDMFQAVIQAAGLHLADCLESICYRQGRFYVTDGCRKLVYRCVYENDLSDDGVPYPGSGSWSAIICDEGDADACPDQPYLQSVGRRLQRLIDRLFALS